MKPNKNTIRLWHDRDAVKAATCYAEIFPDTPVGTLLRAPSDNPSSPEGEALTVAHFVMGRASNKT
jgi:predicted 3-demethylubiquinone-9 3-methyltransferase (glyoxalase superfamily)